MQLTRYSTEELQKICSDIFYEFMSNTAKGYCDSTTPADLLHKQYEDKLKQYEVRIDTYKQKLATNLEDDVRSSLEKQLKILEEGFEAIFNSSKANQKKVYKANQKKIYEANQETLCKTISATDFARSQIRIPLDKKINSYYDDFTLEVVFYDDVCTLKGKYDEYKKLTTQEEKLNFLIKNTEITHMGLLYINNNRLISAIALLGKLNTSDPRVAESGIVLLPQEFSDFSTLTLKDISTIENNDLKQLIQSKIDLDKENMRELSSIVIRGDRYSIHQSRTDGNCDLYIRYTCRGTGRVYYNLLNTRNLELSSYFDKNDFDSYSKAWWDLNTLGGNPNDEKPVIRC